MTRAPVEREVDALTAAFKPLIEAAARAAREKRVQRRARPRRVAAEPELDIDYSERGCTCFKCAPCAWCLGVSAAGAEEE